MNALIRGQHYVDTGTYLTVSETSMTNGSSGGAVFNYNSELVSMVILGNDGGHYAIPINDLKPIIKNFK